MATLPIDRTTAPVTLPGTMPPMPAVARILARHDRQHLAAFVAVAIDLIDAMDGDPDCEAAGDEGEDDDPDTGVEDDPLGIDPEVDCCLAGDDMVLAGSASRAGLVGEDDGPGDADDAEREQLPDDVPMPLVWSAEHNIFTDSRVPLGRSNLQSSFRTNGNEVRSADSGAVFVSDARSNTRKPGAPV
jgi:hypothetical protein